MKSALLFVLGGLILMMGCSGAGSHLPKTVPAEGVVTLDGQPVEGATVTFIADTGNYHATTTSDASGKFSLNAFTEKTGAVPGSYKVEVNKTVVSAVQDSKVPEGEGVPVNVSYGLPERYSTITTSGLTHTIPETGDTNIKIELKSK